MRAAMSGDSGSVQGSKDTVDTNQSGVRSGLPSEIELKVRMPGDGFTPVVPGGGFDYDAANQMITSIGGTLQAVGTKVADGIVTTLDQAEAVCSTLEAMFLGRAGITVDQIEAVCSKVYDKVSRQQNVKMTEVYAYMGLAGLPIPTNEQIAYFLSTGQTDYNPSQPLPVGGSIPNPIGTISPGGTGGGSIPVPTGIVPIGTVPPGPVGISTPPVYPPGLIPNPCGEFGHMNEHGICVPDFPGQWGPCHGGWPDPVTGLYDTPDGTCGGNSPPPTPAPTPSPTISGGGGNDICPAGYVPDPSGTIVTGITPIPIQNQSAFVQQRFTPQQFGCSGTPILNWGSTNGINDTGVAGDSNTYGIPYITPPGTWQDTQENGMCVGYFVHGFTNVNGQQTQSQVLTYPCGDVVFLDPSNETVYFDRSLPYGMCEISNLGPPTTDGSVPGCSIEPPPPLGQTCPLPVAIGCTPAPGTPSPTPPKDDDDICKMLTDFANDMSINPIKITDWLSVAASPSSSANKFLLSMLGITADPGAGLIPELVARLAKWLTGIVDSTNQTIGCNIPAMLPVSIYQAVLKFVQKWTDIIPRQAETLIEQTSNTLCQSTLPTAAEASSAWLRGGLTDAEWECYTKAEGVKVPHAKKIRDSEQEQTSVHDAVHLWMRGVIDDDGLAQRVRNKGVIGATAFQDAKDIALEWPHMADLVQFMSRHVNNEDAIKDGDLDRNFDSNFNGLIKQWADGAGVSEDLAKFHWRAHWMKVPYDRLREMLHRLRPDKYGPDMAVDRDLMRRQLIQDDYMPGFVDRLMEISYLPITEGDTKHQYMLGMISDDDCENQLKDVSKSPDDAHNLMLLFKQQKYLHDNRMAGYMSLSQLVELRAECLIDPSTFDDAASRVAENEEQLEYAKDAVRLRSQIYQLKQTVKTIEFKMKYNGMSLMEAQQELLQAGVDPFCVPDMTKRMQGNNNKKPKEEAAGQLCTMRTAGIISDSEQAARLTEAGYDAGSVARMVALCTYQIDQKISKAAAKAIKDANAAAAAAAAAAAKAAKDAAKCPPKPCPIPKNSKV